MNMIESNEPRKIWSYIPERDRVIEGLCRRMAVFFPEYFEKKLKNPVFFIGFNNSGKSMVISGLKRQNRIVVYPDEGNADMWFDGYFPWMIKQPDVPPIWCNPDQFIGSVLGNREDNYQRSRAQLGAYLWLVGGESIVNDSGMLGGLLPDIINTFENPKIVHFIRDGRVACYLSARREWSNMMRVPDRYQSAGCELEFEFVLEKMAKYWSWTVDRISSLQNKVSSYIEIRYEDICCDLHEQTRRIESFLDLPEGVVRKGFSQNIVNMNSIVLSDITESHIQIVNRSLGRQLSNKGYLQEENVREG